MGIKESSEQTYLISEGPEKMPPRENGPAKKSLNKKQETPAGVQVGSIPGKKRNTYFEGRGMKKSKIRVHSVPGEKRQLLGGPAKKNKVDRPPHYVKRRRGENRSLGVV